MRGIDIIFDKDTHMKKGRISSTDALCTFEKFLYATSILFYDK